MRRSEWGRSGPAAFGSRARIHLPGPGTSGNFRAWRRVFAHAYFRWEPEARHLAAGTRLDSFLIIAGKIMPEHRTSLSLATLKEVLASVERTIAIFERSGRPLVDPDDNVGVKLRNLRRQLEEQIERHPHNRDK
jgi:hypothetical protein